MGIDAIPPPASGLPARLVLGPALRAQSDGRLVGLVREGYESAFEEIVRRYRRPLDRFAAGIVGGHAEDVTQDSFRKALEALRRGDGEVELRPWLYRIVRNTALNDLRDRPPAAAELADEIVGGGRSAAAEAEERAEVAALTARLRALPEKQRAALVMRELEGMSHEEIAVALGISGGAARQAIARGRAAVRSGFGALIPLPLLRALAGGDGAAEAAVGGGAAAAGAGIGGSFASGSAVLGGGFGAGALKAGLATVFVAGSIGAGVAIDHHGANHHRPDAAVTVPSATGGPSVDGVRPAPSPVLAVDDHGSGAEHEVGDDHGGRSNRHGSHGSGSGDHGGSSGSSHGGPGRDSGSTSGIDSGRTDADDDSPHDTPGSGTSGGDFRRDGTDRASSSGSGRSGGSGDRSGSDSSTSRGGGHGSDDAPSLVLESETAVSPTFGDSGSSTSGSSSGSSGGSGSDDVSGSSSGSSDGSGSDDGSGSSDDSGSTEISP